MRRPIWKKEDFFLIGGQRIDMDPAVVELKDGLPLVWGYDFERQPIGKVNDIRFEDGEITGDVELFDQALEEVLLESGSCRLGGFYKSVEKNEDGTVVLKASLKAVSVVLLANMP